MYSDTYEWSGIFGTSTGYTAAQNLPLWYPHWDNTNGFADFIPFGGWTTPVMKQVRDYCKWLVYGCCTILKCF